MKSILVSRCLLGEHVRYDGGHCRLSDPTLDKLRQHFNLIAICPEVLAGFSVPREPIERLGDKIIDQTGTELTAKFDWARREILTLVQSYNITLALLKEDSPSCGVNQIYDGSFTGKKISGKGVITEFLILNQIQVFSELQIDELLKQA